MDVDCAGSGAAKRRRDRRLRAWHRHVKMTVAMELATASNTVHSPRGLWWEGRETRQGTRRTTAYGHRRPCLRGRGRHLCLRLPGRSGVTAPCGPPQGTLLSSWCRHWPVATASTTPLSPSSCRRLSGRRRRRKKRRGRGRTRFLRLAQYPLPSPVAKRRKKKKKRKKKVPKTSSSSGCGRPYDHQRRVPAVQEVRVHGASDSVLPRSAGQSSCDAETGTHSANCAANPHGPGAVLGLCFTPVVVRRQVPKMVQTEKKTVKVP